MILLVCGFLGLDITQVRLVAVQEGGIIISSSAGITKVKGLSGGAIAGIVIAALVFFAIIAGMYNRVI